MSEELLSAFAPLLLTWCQTSLCPSGSSLSVCLAGIFFYNLIAIKFLPNILPFRFCCKFPCFDIKQQYKKEILIIFYFKCFHVLALISSIPSARILAMTSETCPAAPVCQERGLGSRSALTAHPRSCSPLSLLLNCCPDLLLAYQLAVTPGVLVLLVP